MYMFLGTNRVHVEKRGHFHNLISKTGYKPLAHCEKS